MGALVDRLQDAEDDRVTRIIAYEAGELDGTGTLVLFADLVRTGLAWSLQGHYGRMAAELIKLGVLSSDGDPDWDAYETLVGGGEG